MLTSYRWLEAGNKSKEKNPLEKNHAEQSSKVSKINAKRKKLGKKPLSDADLKVIANKNAPTDNHLDGLLAELDKLIATKADAEETIEVAQGRAVK